LELEGRRIAREHSIILSDDKPVGEVTSGTFSPTLEKTIAMGYVDSDLAALDTLLDVDIRGKRTTAKVVNLPFYKRPATQ